MATHYGVEVNLTDGLDSPKCRFVDSTLEESRSTSYRVTSPPPPAHHGPHHSDNDDDDWEQICKGTWDSKDGDDHGGSASMTPATFLSCPNAYRTNTSNTILELKRPSISKNMGGNDTTNSTHAEEFYMPAISSLFDSLGLITGPSPDDICDKQAPPETQTNTQTQENIQPYTQTQIQSQKQKKRHRLRRIRKSRLEGRRIIPRSNKQSRQKLLAQRHEFNSQKSDITPFHELETSLGIKQSNSNSNSDNDNDNDNDQMDVQEFCQSQHNDRTHSRCNSTSSLVTHEIQRGNWTWSTAWSPDGTHLAMISENSPLIVLDSTSLPVWNIVYCGPYCPPSYPSFSVRSIAWGHTLMAIGGTGEVLILLDGSDFQIRHVLPNMGYIGALDWKPRSNILLVGSRKDICSVYRVVVRKQIKCELIQVIPRDNWVNAVQFSPLGGVFAVVDRSGNASIYSLYETRMKAKLTCITDYDLEGSILSCSWSHNGKWFIMSGEDCRIHIVDTSTWNIVQQITTNHWVFSASASRAGSFLAMGGFIGQMHLSSLEKLHLCSSSNNKIIPCHSSVLLDAQWHPQDHFLSLAGQDGTVQVVDIRRSNRAYQHNIRFASGISSLSISPDGSYLTVAKEDGIVSFVDRCSDASQVVYEVMAPCPHLDAKDICVQWAPKQPLVAIGAGTMVLLLGASENSHDTNVLHSRFVLQKTISELEHVTSINFSPDGKYMVVSGTHSKVYNIQNDFLCERTFSETNTVTSSWSPDGAFLAILQDPPKLTIYETTSTTPSEWKQPIFDLILDSETTALSWGPTNNSQTLYYLAYGGTEQKITVMEIRSKEQCWEVALHLPCPGTILEMDWRRDGMLAVGCSQGSAMIVNLNYLFTGTAVHQMDYKWQRQGITCSVLMERNVDDNEMKGVRWLAQEATLDHVLVLGGSDGIVETIDFS